MCKNFGILCCCCFPILSVAQSTSGSITGKLLTKGYLAGIGVAQTYVDGVVVEAYSAKDTLYTTTVNGVFRFRKVTTGRVVLRFSHVSYKDVIEEVKVKPGETTEVEVTMQEAPQEIESVTVKGDVPVLTIKGDTLVYHAAAVRTFEGDETIKIVEQLPGVLTSENGVSVMGKDISRTYVDGKLIFGNDPMVALQNLLANDVLKIRVYDEYADDNSRRKRRKGDEMRRVFNIETKSKLIQATTGHFLASYGADLNEGNKGNLNRYGIGTTANFFSESLLLSANAFFNNINRKSNKIADIIAVKSPKMSYDRATYANIGMEKNWNMGEYSPIHLRGYYTFSDNYMRSENITEQRYFPSSDYTSRLYADTSQYSSANRLHHADLEFSHPELLLGRFSLDHHMQFENNHSDTYHSYASIVDGGTPVGGRARNFNKQSRYAISDRLQWNISRVYVECNFDISNDDGRGFRMDTLTSTATRRELSSISDGLSRKITVDIIKKIMLSEEKYNYLDFAYKYTWEKSHQKKTSLDLADVGHGMIDATNTYNFTNDYNTHKAVVELGLTFPKIKANLNIKSAFSTTGVNRDERFPDNNNYNKRFNAFLPSISFMSSKMTRQLIVQYLTGVLLPSIEQLRPRLDDANLYMLVAGNRKLNQSYTHCLLSTYSTMFGKANNNISVKFEAKKTNNVIAYKRTFFTVATYLPEWDYTVPAQSTLTTYENVDGLWMASADIKWIRPLRKLKSQLTVNVIFNYDNTPSFVEDALNRTQSYTPELNLSMKTNVSRSFRFTVGTRTSYIYSSNNIGQDDKYFQQGALVSTEFINIFKRFYFNATYSLSYYKHFGGNNYGLNNQILNVAVGCKVLKRRGDISFTAYDILNRNFGYKTAMYSNYIQNIWTRSFGRYFTFNIAYKFNKSKSGVTNSSVKDGSVGENLKL